MLRLRKILLSDYLYIVLFTIGLISFFSFYNNRAIYNASTCSGKIILKKESYFLIEDKSTCYIKGTTKYLLGDYIKVEGDYFDIPKKEKSLSFNFYNYLVNLNVRRSIVSKNITKLKEKSLIYKLKNKLMNHSSTYTKALTIGVNDIAIKDVYQKLGISHIFAISGAHISLIALVLEKLLKKVYEEKRFIIVSVFIYFFYLLTGTVSVLRAFLFYLVIKANNIFYFHIKKKNMLMLILSIILIYKPWYILNIGFIYSYVIAATLYLFSEDITSINLSFYAFLISFPITIYYNFEVNLMSIINNILIVPFISMVIFPMSFINLLIPLKTYEFLIYLLEVMSIFLNKFSVMLTFKKVNNIYYLIYFVVIYLFLKKKSLKRFSVFLLMILIHLSINNISPSYVAGIDVGQGDSFLVRHKGINILIDTGEEKAYSNLYKFLKREGISKIDALIISHGDHDHIGGAHLIEKDFQVKGTYINSNNITESEKELKYTKFHNLAIKDIYIENLNLNVAENENNSSLVLLVDVKDKKLLFLGDVSLGTSDKINYPKVDIVKLSHHGSKYSNSKKMIEETEAQIHLIGAGNNNRYKHPHEEVLEMINHNYLSTHELGTFKLLLD